MGVKSVNRFRSWFYCFFYGTFGSRAVGQRLQSSLFTYFLAELQIVKGKWQGFVVFGSFNFRFHFAFLLWLIGYKAMSCYGNSGKDIKNVRKPNVPFPDSVLMK